MEPPLYRSPFLLPPPILPQFRFFGPKNVTPSAADPSRASSLSFPVRPLSELHCQTKTSRNRLRGWNGDCSRLLGSISIEIYTPWLKALKASFKVFGTKDAFRNFYLNPAPRWSNPSGGKVGPRGGAGFLHFWGEIDGSIKKVWRTKGRHVCLSRKTRPSDHVVNRDEYGFRSTSNDRWGVGLPYDIPTVLCLRCVIGASVGLCCHRTTDIWNRW